MQVIKITENLLKIFPSEGYLLAFRGTSSGSIFSSILISADKNLDDLIEVKKENVPIKIPIIQEDLKSKRLDEIQQYMIKKSKILLETFLSNNPLNFEGKLYNVTTEAQSHLNSVIKASEYAQSLNIEYTPLWNSIEGIREPYSLDTLKTLFIEIQKYVALFVIQQQKIEQDILNIKDIIELLNYNIEYNLI